MFGASAVAVSGLGLLVMAAPPKIVGPNGQSAPAPASTNDKSVSDLHREFEERYKKQELEAAGEALGAALSAPNLTPHERAQLHVLEGLLNIDVFKETAALKAFGDALKLDRNVELPEFAAPKAARFFAELKALTSAPASIAVAPARPAMTECQVLERPLKSWAWAPAAGGVVAGGFGVMFALQARASYDRLLSGDRNITSIEQLDRVVASGKTTQTAGVVLIGIGALGLTAGAVMYFVNIPLMRHVALGASRQGVAVQIGGVLP